MSTKLQKEKLLYLDSKNATYNSEFDFQFNLDKTVSNVKAIQLLSFNIPHIYDTVSKWTNTLVFLESATQHVVTVDPGVYDTYSLAAAIKASMEAASSASNTFSVVFNDITNVYTITASTTDFTLLYEGSTIRDVIGLTALKASTTRVLVLQEQVNFFPSTQIEIRLPGLISSIETSGIGRNDKADILYMASLSGHEPYTYVTNSFESNEVAVTKNEFSNIIISIVDQSGTSSDTWDVMKYPFSMLLRIIPN